MEQQKRVSSQSDHLQRLPTDNNYIYIYISYQINERRTKHGTFSAVYTCVPSGRSIERMKRLQKESFSQRGK